MSSTVLLSGKGGTGRFSSGDRFYLATIFTQQPLWPTSWTPAKAIIERVSLKLATLLVFYFTIFGICMTFSSRRQFAFNA